MSRNRIHHRKHIDIGRGYHVDVKDIIRAHAEGILLPEDQLVAFLNRMTGEVYFKSSADPEEHMHVFAEILRWEEESDEEFSQRKKREERERLAKEQRDTDEYLRLKAKFEP